MRITRLFIDNYKCFVGFDFKPQAIQPIFGLNGTGKSTLFEVLASLKQVVTLGHPINDHFGERVLTRWLPTRSIHIVLEIGHDDWEYRYELKIVLDGTTNYPEVRQEVLKTQHRTIFERNDDRAVLHNDMDGTSQELLVDMSRSGLSLVNPRRGTNLLVGFRSWLANLHLIALHPGLMRESSSAGEETTLNWGGSNFVSWLRHIAQKQLAAMGDLNTDLREALEGFDSLRLDSEGGRRVLRTLMRDREGHFKGIPFDFGELSDGQRVLIALYTILHGVKGRDVVLLLDEPANYLALAEIQPYLLRLRDAVGEGIAQLFVVTHNPEAINDLAPDHPVIFARADDGSVQIRTFPDTNPDGLSAAELVARGWESP